MCLSVLPELPDARSSRQSSRELHNTTQLSVLALRVRPTYFPQVVLQLQSPPSTARWRHAPLNPTPAMNKTDPAPTISTASDALEASLSRNSSAKRKRCGKSPLKPSIASGRLFQPEDCRTAASQSSIEPSSSSSTAALYVSPQELLLDSTAEPPDMAVQNPTLAAAEALCQISVAVQTAESNADSPPGSNIVQNHTTWSFLSHPALRLLPKWPALYQSVPQNPRKRIIHRPQPAPTQKLSDALLVPSNKPETQLLSLLSIPPIAASLASNLYGHDLLNLRRLNSSFTALLSTQPAHEGQRPYFHALLLKSLLCPRTDTDTEPLRVPCRSAGGNVGPCMFCEQIICTTCMAPEIWTNRRYRYICPPCATPIASDDDTCNCQSLLWTCRRCYTPRWLEDIQYSSGGWITASGSTCGLCNTEYAYESDYRLPFKFDSKRRVPFKTWMESSAAPIVSSRGKKARKPRILARSTGVTLQDSTLHVRRRPVLCGWCQKRVDPEKEDWFLRPDRIRLGEEKGRMWLEEVERRRQRDRENLGPEADAGGSSEGSDDVVSNNP